MNHMVKTNDRRIRALLDACCPGWPGRRVSIVAQDRYQVDGWWWDGESWRDPSGDACTYVCSFHLNTGKAGGFGPGVPVRDGGRVHATFSVRPGVAIVERRVYREHDAGVTVVVHPDDFGRFGLALSGAQRAALASGAS